MKVWRLVINGTKEQLSNPSINKEKSEEINKQQDKTNQEQNNIQEQSIDNQTSSNEQNSQQSESSIDTIQSNNNQEQSTDNQTSTNEQSTSSNQEKSNSETSSNSKETSSDNKLADNKQESNSSNQEQSIDNQTSSNEQSTSSNQEKSNSKTSSNSKETSSDNQTSTNEQSTSSNQEKSNSETSSNSEETISDNKQESNLSNQEQKSTTSTPNSQKTKADNKTSNNEQTPSSSQEQSSQSTEQNNLNDNLEEQSTSNEENLEEQKTKEDNNVQETPKKKKKQHQHNKNKDSENPQDKGRWKKNKPNRQNPKNDFKGIYRKQKEKIKAQQEKTKAARLQHLEKKEGKNNKPQISKENLDILDELQQIPPFEERDHGGGIAKLGIEHDKLPASLIRMLIQKFVNQRFKKNKSDLNIRGTSIEKKQGFHKWDVPQIAKHLKSKQYTQIMTDKYSYQYANGANETIPLSFYFDLSGSMTKFNPLLVVIIRELLKCGVKVLVGANEQLEYQIDSIDPTTKDEEILEIFKYLQYVGIQRNDSFMKGLKYKNIYGRQLYEYLEEKKAEKCVIFSDFDPMEDVIKLSLIAQVYWFGFENIYFSFNRFDNISLEDHITKVFKGFYYKVQNADDIVYGLEKINSNRFEALCYIDKHKQKLKGRD